MGTAPTWVCPDCKAVVYTPHPMRFCPKCRAGPFPGWGRNPLVENLLAVARKTGFYKDLDSGDKDILYARQIVKLHWKKGMSWAVSSPGMNTLLVPSKDLIAFKDPIAASKKYKAGEYWGVKKNPSKEWHLDRISWLVSLYSEEERGQKSNDVLNHFQSQFQGEIEAAKASGASELEIEKARKDGLIRQYDNPGTAWHFAAAKNYINAGKEISHSKLLAHEHIASALYSKRIGIPNPIHPQALVALKRMKADEKQGHDAADYWRGAAAAYFTANPAATKSISMATISAKLDSIPAFPRPRYYAPTANLPDPITIRDWAEWKRLADSGYVA